MIIVVISVKMIDDHGFSMIESLTESQARELYEMEAKVQESGIQPVST